MSDAPALKDRFDEARYHSVAEHLAVLHSRFDRKRFLAVALDGLDALTLLQRLRRMAIATSASLPLSYSESLEVLRALAPRIDHSFVSLFLPDFVGLYGLESFDESMEALREFTRYGSSEFAIREFLKRDLTRTLGIMRGWAYDPDEQVRRLASEGSRPRLPWSFRLQELIEDPRPSLPILNVLSADPSLYVRKSVANHINDISRDHPGLALEFLRSWDLDEPHRAWIAKRALRTLIKEGHIDALTLFGVGEPAQVRVDRFCVAPIELSLGEKLCLCLELTSLSSVKQKLLIDYTVHYVKSSGCSSAKVFKWAERELGPGECLRLEKGQIFRDFTTRKHYPGDHRIEVIVNGISIAEGMFCLRVPL